MLRRRPPEADKWRRRLNNLEEKTRGKRIIHGGQILRLRPPAADSAQDDSGYGGAPLRMTFRIAWWVSRIAYRV